MHLERKFAGHTVVEPNALILHSSMSTDHKHALIMHGLTMVSRHFMQSLKKFYQYVQLYQYICYVYLLAVVKVGEVCQSWTIFILLDLFIFL